MAMRHEAGSVTAVEGVLLVYPYTCSMEPFLRAVLSLHKRVWRDRRPAGLDFDADAARASLQNGFWRDPHLFIGQIAPSTSAAGGIEISSLGR